MSSQSICMFCNDKSNKNLTKFTKETLDRSEHSRTFRKGNGIDVSHVTLPKSLNNIQGYHQKCYEEFTSYKLMIETMDKVMSNPSYSPKQDISKEEMTKALESKVLSKSHIQRLKEICLICMEDKSSHPEVFYTFNNSSLDYIKSYATVLNDIFLLKRLESVESQNVACFMYHGFCKQNYPTVFKDLPKEATLWKKVRNNHQTAYKKVSSSVNEKVVNQKKCYLLKYMEYEYLEALQAAYGYETKDIESKFFGTTFLDHFLLKTFESKISIVEINQEKVIKPGQGVENKDINLKELQKDVGVLLMAIYLQQHTLHFKKDEESGNPLFKNMKHLVKVAKNMGDNDSDRQKMEALMANVFGSKHKKSSNHTSATKTKSDSLKDNSNVPKTSALQKSQAAATSVPAKVSSDSKLSTDTKSSKSTTAPKAKNVTKSSGISKTSVNPKSTTSSTTSKSSSDAKTPTTSTKSAASGSKSGPSSMPEFVKPNINYPCYLDVKECPNGIMISYIPTNMSIEEFEAFPSASKENKSEAKPAQSAKPAASSDTKCPAKKAESSRKQRRVKSRLMEVD